MKKKLKIHKNNTNFFYYMLLIIFMVGFTMSWNGNGKPVVEAAGEEFYITNQVGGSSNGEIILNGSSANVYLQTSDSSELLSTDEISWISGSTSIITVDKQAALLEDSNGKKYATAKITSICPGTTTLTAQIVRGSTVKTIFVKVTVKLEVDKSDDTIPGFIGSVFSTDLDEIRYLVMNRDDTPQNITLKCGTDPTKLNWDVNDDSVVQIQKDEANKKVTVKPIGAGTTTITVSTTVGDKPASEEIRVFVQPQFYTGATAGGQSISSPVVLTENNGLSYLSYTADKMDRITWKVYKGSDFSGAPIVNTATGLSSDLIKLSNSSTNGVLQINAKAGTYSIEACIKGTINNVLMEENTVIKHAYATLNVSPILTPDTLNRSINVGNTYDLCDAFNIADLKAYFNSFTIADPNVLSVDLDTGILTGLNPGKTTVSLKDASGNVKSILTITVIDGIALDRAHAEMYVGGKFSLVTVKPTGSGTVTWSSSNESVATVSSAGTVTGLKTGNATITASLKIDGVIKSATCTVLVKASVTSITLSPTNATIGIDEYKTIKATIIPSNFSNLNIKWVSSDESIASIEDSTSLTANIKGINGGECVISAINMDNAIVGTCKVKVVKAIETLKLNYTSFTANLSMGVLQLLPDYNNDATETELTWQSTNTTVAEVSKTGLVALKGSGTASIIVKPAYNPKNVIVMCTITVTKNATGLKLDITSKTMEVGDTYKINYDITPEDASDKSVTWSSMDSKVASVSSNGTVTAAAAGQTYIIAKTADGNSSATCTITVTQAATGVKLDVSSLTMKAGETYQVTATVSPNNSTETKLTWTSKDTAIATVSDTGKVKAVSAGQTIILVKTKKGEVVTLYVTVQEAATGITLNYTEKTVAIGRTFVLIPNFTPSSVTNKKVTWKTSNTKIVTVSDNGTVKGIKGGAAVVTCTTEDGGFIATCLVSVKEPVTSIKLKYSFYSLGLGKKFTLTAKVDSNYASNQTLKWTSSNTKVVTVNSKGKLTAKSLGTATIRVVATDGSGAEDECEIRVVRQVTGIGLNKSTVTLIEGKNIKLTAIIKPSNATYKSAKWSSTDTSVALVDSSGRVTGLKVGTATVKAMASDNSGRAAYCVVNVIKAVPATTVTVSQKDMILVRGGTGSVAVSIQPSNSTDTVTYASDSRTVATVNNKGRVTARKAGVAAITITTTSGKQAMVNVTVVGLNETSVVMEQYDTRTLWVDGMSKGIIWYSANPGIATVSNGNVVARKAGITTIYATINGIKLGCRVVVKDIK